MYMNVLCTSSGRTIIPSPTRTVAERRGDAEHCSSYCIPIYFYYLYTPEYTYTYIYIFVIFQRLLLLQRGHNGGGAVSFLKNM